MTGRATPTGESRGGRLALLQERWQERLARFATTEVITSGLIVSTWSVLAGLGLGPLLVILVLLVLGLWLHLVAVETGNHAVLWLTTGWLLILMLVASQATFARFGPLSYTVASATVLAHNELVRISYARRRRGLVDESTYVSAAIGFGLASMVAVIGIGLAQLLADTSTNRSWLFMPVAALALVGLGLAITVVPVRNAPRADRHRWRPGDRIPPQPLGDDGTTTTSDRV